MLPAKSYPDTIIDFAQTKNSISFMVFGTLECCISHLQQYYSKYMSFCQKSKFSDPVASQNSGFYKCFFSLIMMQGYLRIANLRPLDILKSVLYKKSCHYPHGCGQTGRTDAFTLQSLLICVSGDYQWWSALKIVTRQNQTYQCINTSLKSSHLCVWLLL